MKKPNAILTGDWHLREDTPVCRTDNFWETQWTKVQFVSKLQKKYECIVIHSGDLFHHWKPSPYLLTTTMKYLPVDFYTVYGNHDLPQHSLELSDKCGINVLKTARKLNVFDGTHWKQEPGLSSYLIGKPLPRAICVWHVMTYRGELPWPGCEALTAKEILKKYPQYDLIVTGDNHKTFVEKYKDRLLVNPGSITRQTVTQIDHKPCVFLWYAKTNEVEPVYLPIEEVISKEHIEIKQKRDHRIDAFVSSLDTNWDLNISLKANFQKFFKRNQVREQTKELITKYVEL